MAGDGSFSHITEISLGNIILKICLLQVLSLVTPLWAFRTGCVKRLCRCLFIALLHLRILFSYYRALDKKEYWVIVIFFCLFCISAYVVTPHPNRLNETVQVRGHNKWFR